MKIFGISDLHLSFGSDKPMDIFGDQWKDHAGQIEENWRAVITDEDWVLMGGDLSWALKMDEVIPDLEFVDSLPGQKLMIKGNHAHWWGSRSKVEAILPSSIRVLQYDAFVLPDGTGVVGTRGWNPPGRNEGGRGYSAQDQKVYDREVQRLQLSIQDLGKKEHKRVLAELRNRLFSLKYDFIDFDQLQDFLLEWFIQHTSTIDMKLAAFLGPESAKE